MSEEIEDENLEKETREIVIVANNGYAPMKKIKV